MQTPAGLVPWLLGVSALGLACAPAGVDTSCRDEGDCPSGYLCREQRCVRQAAADGAVDGAAQDVGPRERSPSDHSGDVTGLDRRVGDSGASDLSPAVDAVGRDSSGADRAVVDAAPADRSADTEPPPCTGPADCDDGLGCTGVETCDDGRCRSPGNPCVAPTPACLTASGGGHLCVQCQSPADCAVLGLNFCVEYACVACAVDDDCGDGNPCTADTCGSGTCAHADLDRGDPCAGGHCDGQGACVECTDSAHCLQADRPVCVGDVCVACASNPDCDDQDDCTTDYCGAGNLCHNDPVTRGTPCAGGYCDGGTGCVACTQDGHCAGVPGRPYCRGDVCVQCVSAADCDDGKPCTIDACSPSFACTYTFVDEGQRVAGCADYCDGEGNCDICTRDVHCQMYDACRGCVGGFCFHKAGLPCVAGNCQDYVYGLDDYYSWSYLTCVSYAYHEIPGTCDAYGSCWGEEPSIACQWQGPGVAIASCQDVCAVTETERWGCTPGDSAYNVSPEGFCVMNGPTPACSGESCYTPSQSNSYTREQVCISGHCLLRQLANCGNYLCQMQNGQAVCPTTCNLDNQCVGLGYCNPSHQCCEDTDLIPCQ